MMDYVIFEDERGNVLRPKGLGLLLKSFQAPPPSPKLYRETIEGADGEIDMSEWAGEIRYNSRTVTIGFRDMSGNMTAAVTNFLHGRKIKITHSGDLAHYYYGRCDSADTKTQRRVMDSEYVFTCYPYRRAANETRVTRLVAGTAEITLKAARESVIPTITADAKMTLNYQGSLYSVNPGTFTIPTLIITDSPEILTVTGNGNITLTWRDGEM